MIAPDAAAFAAAYAAGRPQVVWARIVADTWRGQPRALALDLHVRPFGKHRVQVGGDGDERRLVPAWADAPAQAHDVAFLVLLHVSQAGRAQHFQVHLRPGGFLERRRRNLGERDDFRNEPIVIAVHHGHGLLEPAATPDPGQSGVVLTRLGGQNGGGQSPDAGRNHTSSHTAL